MKKMITIIMLVVVSFVSITIVASILIQESNKQELIFLNSNEVVQIIVVNLDEDFIIIPPTLEFEEGSRLILIGWFTCLENYIEFDPQDIYGVRYIHAIVVYYYYYGEYDGIIYRSIIIFSGSGNIYYGEETQHGVIVYGVQVGMNLEDLINDILKELLTFGYFFYKSHHFINDFIYINSANRPSISELGYMPNRNLWLEIQWEANSYRVYFCCEVELGTSYIYIQYNRQLLVYILEFIPFRENKVFLSWYKNGARVLQYTKMPPGNIELEAKFIGIEISLDIDLYSLGLEGQIDYISVRYGESIKYVLNNFLPMRKGYLFSHWLINGETLTYNHLMRNSHIFLEAVFEKHLLELLTIISNVNEERILLIQYGRSIKQHLSDPKPTEEDYIFVKWLLDNETLDYSHKMNVNTRKVVAVFRNLIEDCVGYTSNLNFKLSQSGTYYIVTGISNSQGNRLDLILPTRRNGGILVKAIADHAFQNRFINSVVFPKYIERIGRDAFMAHRIVDLKLENLPNLQTIGNGAFRNAAGDIGATSVTFSNLPSLLKVEDNVFINNIHLVNIVFYNVNYELTFGRNVFQSEWRQRNVMFAGTWTQSPAWWSSGRDIFGNTARFLEYGTNRPMIF